MYSLHGFATWNLACCLLKISDYFVSQWDTSERGYQKKDFRSQ